MPDIKTTEGPEKFTSIRANKLPTAFDYFEDADGENINQIASRRLLYTISFDISEATAMRGMTKVFVASLLRTGFNGEILIFKNYKCPVFARKHSNVTEIFIDTTKVPEEKFPEFACRFKYDAAEHIANPEGYSAIMYCDCDFLALRNIDSLFDISENNLFRYVKEPNQPIKNVQFLGYFTDDELESSNLLGSNAGNWCVVGNHFRRHCQKVLQIYESEPFDNKFWGDQPAWNRFVVDQGDKGYDYTVGEICFPLAHDPEYQKFSKATLLHFCGGTPVEKVKMQFSLFIDCFYSDAAPVLIDLLEF